MEKSWKKEKSWRSEESKQNIVVNETFVKNSVMNEKDVKNIVMDAKTDPKVVMDLSILKIGGWHTLQPGNSHFLEQFMDENEPWLLRRMPNREIFFVSQHLERPSVSQDQHMKKLLSLRESLHVMMQSFMQQHFC